MKWPWSKREPVYSPVGEALWGLLHNLDPVYESGNQLKYPSKGLHINLRYPNEVEVLVVFSDKAAYYTELTRDDHRRLNKKVAALLSNHCVRSGGLQKVATERAIREALGLDREVQK